MIGAGILPLGIALLVIGVVVLFIVPAVGIVAGLVGLALLVAVLVFGVGRTATREPR